MLALTYVRGQEAKTFGCLLRLSADEGDRAAAIRALKRIGRGRLAQGSGPASVEHRYGSHPQDPDRTAHHARCSRRVGVCRRPGFAAPSGPKPGRSAAS